MLDNLPPELFLSITDLLSQEDKVALTYISKTTYIKTLPALYRRLYLNEKHYYPSDLDNSLGTHCWSVLYYPYDSKKETRNELSADKFQCLLNSLTRSPERLCPLIQAIHCTWNLDDTILKTFLSLLLKHGTNLQYFESFLKSYISDLLIHKAEKLETLTLTPPKVMPDVEAANEEYYNISYTLFNSYNMENIQTLNIHVNACTFFQKIKNPLKIKNLCINLRPDTYNTQIMNLEDLVHYYDIFDTNSLKELEVLSWYQNSDSELNIYGMWQLEDFWQFKNIEEFTLLSLFANEYFLSGCLANFENLKRLKLDYMFDVALSKRMVDYMGQSKCASTLEYIDVKFEPLDPALIFIEQDEVSLFNINLVCKCQDCNDTLHDVILRKYFPTQESLTITDFSDVEKRNFLLQMFKLYPIIPYCPFLDRYPSIGYNAAPLSHHVAKVNSLLKYAKEQESRKITESDIIKIYHAHIHSLKKSLDYFLQNFLKLDYLVINDLPTKIIQIDGLQKCNIPIFHNYGYKSNQVYELVNDESLFD